ncbi:hypothetical protein COO60DRAFT_1228007 [Scenedesmus sp. NREL 46B-D3]|nr:hypothetical protein COO60DRAFT_1228007 [Scenedesmus sp. NREL 46B-D3]
MLPLRLRLLLWLLLLWLLLLLTSSAFAQNSSCCTSGCSRLSCGCSCSYSNRPLGCGSCCTLRPPPLLTRGSALRLLLPHELFLLPLLPAVLCSSRGRLQVLLPLPLPLLLWPRAAALRARHRLPLLCAAVVGSSSSRRMLSAAATGNWLAAAAGLCILPASWPAAIWFAAAALPAGVRPDHWRANLLLLQLVSRPGIWPVRLPSLSWPAVQLLAVPPSLLLGCCLAVRLATPRAAAAAAAAAAVAASCIPQAELACCCCQACRRHAAAQAACYCQAAPCPALYHLLHSFAATYLCPAPAAAAAAAAHCEAWPACIPVLVIQGPAAAVRPPAGLLLLLTPRTTRCPVAVWFPIPAARPGTSRATDTAAAASSSGAPGTRRTLPAPAPAAAPAAGAAPAEPAPHCSAAASTASN